jgi:L-tartrate/succinate antiporter
MDATLAAIVVIGLMLIAGIVKWDDVLGNKAAWNVLVWFATLVTMADGLFKVGFVTWFSKVASALLAGFPPMVIMGTLVALFFFVHYMFASLTAHTTAILPVMLAVGVAIPGIPAKPFALLLCYSLGIMGIITPYATGPGPVYYGSGYIGRKDFWILGAIFGIIFIAALIFIGIPSLSCINL